MVAEIAEGLFGGMCVLAGSVLVRIADGTFLDKGFGVVQIGFGLWLVALALTPLFYPEEDISKGWGQK